MRRRTVGVVIAASAALLAVPSAGWADDPDETCNNGANPVVYQLTNVNSPTDGSTIVRARVRVLCVIE